MASDEQRWNPRNPRNRGFRLSYSCAMSISRVLWKPPTDLDELLFQICHSMKPRSAESVARCMELWYQREWIPQSPLTMKDNDVFLLRKKGHSSQALSEKIDLLVERNPQRSLYSEKKETHHLYWEWEGSDTIAHWMEKEKTRNWNELGASIVRGCPFLSNESNLFTISLHQLYP